MKIAMLASLLLLCLTAAAQARLGESISQLVSRYGPPVSTAEQKPGPGKVAAVVDTYQKNGFQIVVTRLGDVSAAESFKKLNGDAFTSDEVQTLLEDNSAGRAWQAPQQVNGKQQWLRDDGSIASLDGGHVLTLVSAELLNMESSAKQLQAAPSLQGF
jgi:hypothetical protein